MIDDEAIYAQIVSSLEVEAPDLSESVLTRWYHSGHQAWLKDLITSGYFHYLRLIAPTVG